jgi:antirestriction protein
MTISTHTLQAEADALIIALNEGGGSTSDRLRLNAIEELKIEVGPEQWENGVQLISEYEFEDHARDVAEELGAIPPNVTWPCDCIDWEWAARELRMDYRKVEFEGTEYLFPAI